MPQPKSSRSTSTRARKPAAKRATTTRAKTTRTTTKAARAPAKTTRAAAKPSAATSKAEANLKSLRTTLSRGVVVTQGHLKDALDEAVKAGKLSRKEATELARNIVAAGRKQADGFRKDIDQVLSRKQ